MLIKTTKAVYNREFKEISSNINIPREDLQKEIQPYLEVELHEAVSYFAREISFIPDRKD
jgi:hypothetical protein